MASISPKSTTSIKLIVVCIAMLVPTGLAQLPLGSIPGILPIQPVPELLQCWKTLTSVPACLAQINNSLHDGKNDKIGPVCCAAITQVSENCWKNMFPANPSFSPSLKHFCAPKAVGANGASKISFPGLLPVPKNETIAECWSSLANVKGCASEINKALFSGQISGIGHACCKAVTVITDKCLQIIFTFNPLFPALLKSFCAKLITGAPAPAVTN
ncbi:hypothetical protein LWI29_008819 [Acer saccharum]|uniref:Prolamin-like domain-containing protein n=1 Tax=Acer saccharum TaxID=4024 RepID=A0AA39UR59_ACESA|nr:hypothetical protein LWI29_008819 [Acer saccharum]